MADHNLGTIRGTIKIDYDGAGIVKAKKDVDSLDGKFAKASKGILKAFGGFSKGAVKTAGAITLVTNASSLLASTLAVVGPLVAAGFAAAPALIAGFASAMIVGKVAVMGVGEALKNASGDSKKFEESLKGLSPEAQKFARAFKEALPFLKSVQKSMQDSFFKGSGNSVKQVSNAVRSLRTEAAGVAGQLGDVAKKLTATVTSGKNVNNLKAILRGVNDFLKEIKSSLGGLITGFLGLSAQGASFGKVFGQKIGAALANLAKWLSTIDLKKIFAEALPIIKAVGSFLSDVAIIAKQLFSIFIGDGANAAGVLGTLASGMAAFLQSAEGQAALDSLRTAMATISGATGQVFLALLQALAPAIVALAPGVGELATQIAGVLVPAINLLSPLLTALAGFLSSNMSWLGPLTGAIVAAAAAYKIYGAAVALVTGVQSVLNSQLAFSTLAWIRNTAAVIAARVAALATSIAVGTTMVAAWIANTAVMMANRVAMVASVAVMYAVRAATLVWKNAQLLLNLALIANPIGLVVVAIVALVAALIYAYTHSENFRAVVQLQWAMIKAVVLAVVHWITGVAVPAVVAAWNAIASATRRLWSALVSAWNAIRSSITSAVNATRSVVTAVWNAIVSVIRRSINTIKSVISSISSVVGVVRSAFERARSAVSSAISGIVSLVRSLPGKASSALSGLGGLLYSKGQALIQGFISGILSMVDKVASAAKSVVNSVTQYLPGSPAKKGPLSGRGYVFLRAQRFMDDFSAGMDSKMTNVSSSSLAMARLLAARSKASEMLRHPGTAPYRYQPVPTTIARNSTASSAATGRTNAYTIKIGSKTLATLVTDALTGAPVEVAKSNRQGVQQLGWAGSGRKG